MESETPWIRNLPMPLVQRVDGERWRTRFAPAPTGLLHLGHLVNALHVWGLAMARGGVVSLRIEDHDRARCRERYEDALLEDLEWLGLEPDRFEGRSFRADRQSHPARQSNQGARYEAALEALDRQALIFPCRCTRRDIERVSPHAEGEEPCYPGTCRNGAVAPASTLARRFRMPAEPVTFSDLRLGVQRQHPAMQCGDVLLRDRLGQWTYQCAVVVDDMAHDVDVVIRGEDLLASTGRQFLMARALARPTAPHVLHHALVRHPDGRKLSKAFGDTGLRDLRAAGWTREALFGHAAHLAGLIAKARPLALDDVAALFAP